MRGRWWISLGAAGAFLAAPLAPAAAQVAGLPDPPPSGRLSVDGYVSQYRLAFPEARTRLNGVGARVMWTLAPTTTPERQRLAEHLAIGAFVASTPSDGVTNDGEVRTALYGAQLDVRPLRAPIAGLVEPVLSLGAGLMDLEATTPNRWQLRDGTRLVPRDVPLTPGPPAARRERTYEVMAPAVGVMVSPRPDFALRFDVRQLRSRREHAVEVASGVSLKI